MAKNAQPQEKIAAKRAVVLGSRKKTRRPLHLFLLGACAALAIGGGVFFLGQQGGELSPVAQAVTADAQAAEVTIPVSQFEGGTCRFFEHRTTDGVTIRYFVLKSSDGVIRSAFDACDSCWHAGKGYTQEGDEMVCRNCRQRFPSVKVNEVKGGCNPSPLPNQIRDGKIVIRVEDILSGRQYFDLKQGA